MGWILWTVMPFFMSIFVLLSIINQILFLGERELRDEILFLL